MNNCLISSAFNVLFFSTSAVNCINQAILVFRVFREWSNWTVNIHLSSYCSKTVEIKEDYCANLLALHKKKFCSLIVSYDLIIWSYYESAQISLILTPSDSSPIISSIFIRLIQHLFRSFGVWGSRLLTAQSLVCGEVRHSKLSVTVCLCCYFDWNYWIMRLQGLVQRTYEESAG